MLHAVSRVLELVALTTVRAGEEVTSGYISARATTVERRKTLWENWFFHCSCPRHTLTTLTLHRVTSLP